MITIEKSKHNTQWEYICKTLGVDTSLDEIKVKVVSETAKKPKKKKVNYKEKFIKAAEILKTVEGVEFPVELYRFGTYTQYESAGEEVNKWQEIEIFDDYDIGEDKEEELDTLLSFINKKYIKSIGGEMYGQNVLLLNEDGTTEFDGFRI